MKIAITGLANSGKTTIFNALTGLNIPITPYPTIMEGPNRGIVKVPDDRLSQLSDIYQQKKIVHAEVEYIDYIGFAKENIEQNKRIVELIKDVNAIINTVWAFKDDTIMHPLDSINPVRDAEYIETELIFSDLEFVEKRLDNIDESLKKGRKIDNKEKDILIKCRESLEQGVPLRNLDLADEDIKSIRHLQFISIKPLVFLLNISENDIGSDSVRDLSDNIAKKFSVGDEAIIPLCGKIEMEIAQLPPEDAKAFMNDYKIDESALKKLINTCYRLLGLISFFTIGKDEVRAWTIKKGTTYHKAAGKVHSDMEKGFIKAEVISLNDFIESGSMVNAREKGCVRLEAKEHIVKDGDIINFRFNV